MPHTISKEVYYFDELSPEAKEKAREWYRQASDGDNFFAEFIIEDAAQAAEILGFNVNTHSVKLMGGWTRMKPSIWWSLDYCQSDGACFDARYYFKADASAKIREYAPRDEILHGIADSLTALGSKYPGLYATINSDDRYMSSTVVDYGYDGVEDESIDSASYVEIREGLNEAARNFGQWIYTQLRDEHECQNADEQVDESIRVNEYEFHQDGRRAI